MAGRGIAVRLPVARSTDDGYELVDSYNDLARQNLKMLILTSPGERVMEPSFGVGVKNYLFSNISEDIPIKIETKIKNVGPYSSRRAYDGP